MRDSGTSPSTIAETISPLTERRSKLHNTLPSGFVNTVMLSDSVTAIQECGYFAIRDQLPCQREFTALYSLFDQLNNSPAYAKWKDDVNVEADCWLSMPGNGYAYANAPMGLRDRRTRDDKADKVYFQYSREFYHYQRSYTNSTYHRFPLAAAFYEKLAALGRTAENIFRQTLEEIETVSPFATKAIGQQRHDLSVLLKILAYEPSEKWGTQPHYDKSALTLVMNADDLETESFRIARYEPGISTDRLEIPSRRVDDDTLPAVGLLFPGLCLRAVGIGELMPSPHGVVPVTSKRVRHSVIAFLIAPNIDTSMMQTNDLHAVDHH